MSKIRISCASLASIKINSKYLLLLNKRSLKNGILTYTPIGGALEYLPKGKIFLDNLEAEYERNTPDLRFKMDSSNLDLFDKWFLSKENRETDIVRELIEEMVDEEGIFTSLDINEFKSEFISINKLNRIIDGIPNHFYFEIYNIDFSKSKTDEILDFIKNQGNIKKLILVTEQEIENGLTNTNTKIGDNANSILQ